MTHSDVTPNAPPTDQQPVAEQTNQPTTEQPTSASVQPAAETSEGNADVGVTAETAPNANVGEAAPGSEDESQLSPTGGKTKGGNRTTCGAEIIREKLIQRAAEGDREDAMRLQTIRAVIHALFGHDGAACHSMTGAVLKVLEDEARAAAAEGVVGAEGILLAVDDAQKASGTAFSEWLTSCRQK
jgi:hypothetical protein